MAPLVLILIFLLQFEGISGRDFILYKRPGQDAVLPCTTKSSSPPKCSTVEWFYVKDGGQAIPEVMNGKVRLSSPRAARLSVTTDCSLVINLITAEDPGQYTCRQRGDRNTDEDTYLSVLTSNSGRDSILDKRPGQNAVLPCTTKLPSPPKCSTVEWFYNKDGVHAIREVMNGEVTESSARAARLSVTTYCSLVINNVNAEDAGHYTCRQRRESNTDEVTYLSVLTSNSGRDYYLYKRPGQDAVLSCTTESSSPPPCSIVEWFYVKDGVQTISEVMNGEVTESSARAARLSVTTDCSLVINNVTAEDAGHYGCRQGGDSNTDEVTFLSVLTISPSQPGADPNRDDDITLECSLFTRSERPCRENRIRWVDETGADLLGEGDGYRVLQQSACVSFLTVKRQSGRNRKYTCQFVDEQNSVKIEADYTPDLTGVSPLSSVMWIVRVAGLILMIVVTVLVIRNKWIKKVFKNDDNVNDGADVQYENVEAGPAAARPQ